MTIDQDRRYVSTITANQGAIVIELLPKEAPKTVNTGSRSCWRPES